MNMERAMVVSDSAVLHLWMETLIHGQKAASITENNNKKQTSNTKK